MSKPERNSARGGICFLSETYYPLVGGTQTQMRLVASDLVKNGFGIVVVTRQVESKMTRVDEVDGYPVHRVGPTGIGQKKRWGMMLACIPKLVSLRKQYDVIYVNGFRVLGISAVIACILLGKKCVLRAVSSGEMSGAFFEAGLAKAGLSLKSLPVRICMGVRNAILRRADRFIAMTTEVQAETEAESVPREKILRIPNCVDAAEFSKATGEDQRELRNRLDIPIDKTVATYTGRLVSYKGLPVLLRAWQKVCSEHPDVLLLLVGSEANDVYNCEQELREYVKNNSMSASVTFTGEVSNVKDYLRASDIFVLPTENELFSNSLIEAMACGLPVVTTPVGGLKDIVTSGKDGLLIEPGDEDGLAAALSSLVRSRSDAEEMGAEAKRTIEDNYARTVVSERYVDLFGPLCPKGS